MDADELNRTLAQIGWSQHELARRLEVRPDTVRGWVTGRRTVPDNLAEWLRQHRDKQTEVPPLPDGWRRPPSD
jgi:plasmid maintenance system antidote protein VapI